MRILMPSIVDPAESRGGAWTVTKGLIGAMRIAWPGCEVDCIPVSSGSRTTHRLKQLESVLRSSLTGGLPAKMRFTRTRTMRERLSESLSGPTPDLIVLNGSDLIWMLDSLPLEVPVVIVAHNLEHLLYERQLRQPVLRWTFARRALSDDCRRLREMELGGFRKAWAVIFLSDEDRQAMLEALPGLTAAVIPPCFDYEPAPRRRSAGGPLELGMFADFTWWPNRISLDWFLSAVWPSVSGDCHLHLMGHGSEFVGRGVPRITSHGFMPTARDAFARCDLMIAPIIEGAGVNVKVAEALYNGVPVIVTPTAAKGILPEHRRALEVCTNAGEWIALLSGPRAGELAGRSVPGTVRKSFTVEAAARELSSLAGLFHRDAIAAT